VAACARMDTLIAMPKLSLTIKILAANMVGFGLSHLVLPEYHEFPLGVAFWLALNVPMGWLFHYLITPLRQLGVEEQMAVTVSMWIAVVVDGLLWGTAIEWYVRRRQTRRQTARRGQ